MFEGPQERLVEIRLMAPQKIEDWEPPFRREVVDPGSVLSQLSTHRGKRF